MLSFFIHCAGSFIKEQRIWLDKQGSGKRQTLLLARRQALAPVGIIIEHGDRSQVRQTALLQHAQQLLVGIFAAGIRITQRIAQGADRNITTLRQEQVTLALCQRDIACAVRPDTRNGASSVDLPQPEGPAISTRSPGFMSAETLQNSGLPSGRFSVRLSSFSACSALSPTLMPRG